MKVIINGVEIDIIGGSRLTYDVECDSLSVDPIDSPKKERASKPKLDGESERPAKAKSSNKLTQKELRERIVEYVLLHDDFTSQQFITRHCLGENSKNADKRYLKLLLDKMVGENVLIVSMETGRSRYKLP